jgi:hypothetical protein
MYHQTVRFKLLYVTDAAAGWGFSGPTWRKSSEGRKRRHRRVREEEFLKFNAMAPPFVIPTSLRNLETPVDNEERLYALEVTSVENLSAHEVDELVRGNLYCTSTNFVRAGTHSRWITSLVSNEHEILESPRRFSLFIKFYQSYKGSSGVNGSLVTHSSQHSDRGFFLAFLKFIQDRTASK